MRGQLLTASVAAAILTGFSAVANAQSNVTLYGVVDSGFNYTKVDGNSRSGIDSGLAGQSRWGIRGTEQINGDLKAVFMLESGFSADNGSLASYGTAGTKLFGRYSYVGLDSVTYGRLIMGLNRTGDRGGFLVKVKQVPQSALQVADSIALRPQRAECRRWIRAGVGG